jgi:hypothetical protein
MSALAYRQAKEKALLESELEKGKGLQQSMRNEVISLKEMVNEAMSGYARDLQAKDQQIKQLHSLLAQAQYSPEQTLPQTQTGLEVIQ